MRAQTILFLSVDRVRRRWIVGLIETAEKAIRRDSSRLQAAPFQTGRFFFTIREQRTNSFHLPLRVKLMPAKYLKLFWLALKFLKPKRVSW